MCIRDSLILPLLLAYQTPDSATVAGLSDTWFCHCCWLIRHLHAELVTRSLFLFFFLTGVSGHRKALLLLLASEVSRQLGVLRPVLASADRWDWKSFSAGSVANPSRRLFQLTIAVGRGKEISCNQFCIKVSDKPASKKAECFCAWDQRWGGFRCPQWSVHSGVVTGEEPSFCVSTPCCYLRLCQVSVCCRF